MARAIVEILSRIADELRELNAQVEIGTELDAAIGNAYQSVCTASGIADLPTTPER